MHTHVCTCGALCVCLCEYTCVQAHTCSQAQTHTWGLWSLAVTAVPRPCPEQCDPSCPLPPAYGGLDRPPAPGPQGPSHPVPVVGAETRRPARGLRGHWSLQQGVTVGTLQNRGTLQWVETEVTGTWWGGCPGSCWAGRFSRACSPRCPGLWVASASPALPAPTPLGGKTWLPKGG